MPLDTGLKLAPEGTGPEVRVLQLQVFDASGNPTLVNMQVISASDENGFPIIWPNDALAEMTAELKAIRRLLALGFSGMGVDSLDIEGTEIESEV